MIPYTYININNSDVLSTISLFYLNILFILIILPILNTFEIEHLMEISMFDAFCFAWCIEINCHDGKFYSINMFYDKIFYLSYI